jgi:signal transduction histidine kinase
MVMQRHCDRLKRLIEEPLTISRMEVEGVCLENDTRRHQGSSSSAKWVKQMETEIAERGVEVRLNIPANLPRVEVDVYRIEQGLHHQPPGQRPPGTVHAGGGAIIISAAESGRELGDQFS